jgi:hypothetical protein
MTVGKTAAELEAMIMERLREHPACASLYRVVVTPAGDQGQWTADGETRMGIHIMYDCARAMKEVAQNLRRDYHLRAEGDTAAT